MCTYLLYIFVFHENNAYDILITSAKKKSKSFQENSYKGIVIFCSLIINARFTDIIFNLVFKGESISSNQ